LKLKFELFLSILVAILLNSINVFTQCSRFYKFNY